jgi:UDP-N-acetylmuramate--alanine ligase
MDLKNIHSVYFVGIGGIGMSALARYFKLIGKHVAGYDKTETPLTMELAAMGMPVHYQDSIELVPAEFLNSRDTLIVYTPAVPATHKELTYFLAKGFEVKKRSEILGAITRDTYCFAVAGTHGKTTTSCILAHLLKETGTPLTAFLGGISEDFNSNFLFAGSQYSVVEADEYDRSFLRLSPDIACITSMDAVHLDICGDAGEVGCGFGVLGGRW